MYRVTAVNWPMGQDNPEELGEYLFPTFVSAVAAATDIYGDETVFNAIENFHGEYYMMTASHGYHIEQVEIEVNVVTKVRETKEAADADAAA